MNKDLELEIINYELKLIRGTKVRLMKILSKKGKSDEHQKILSDELDRGRSEEQELLNQRDKTQATDSTG